MDDDVSAVVAGFVATTAMTLVLFIADGLSAFQLQIFQEVAVFVGIPENIFLGFVLFYAAGSVAWPLIFISLGRFLPGRTDAIKGMVFSLVLWFSFLLAFTDPPQLGSNALIPYVVLTLLAHLAYGFTLGAVFDYLGDHQVDLV